MLQFDKDRMRVILGNGWSVSVTHGKRGFELAVLDTAMNPGFYVLPKPTGDELAAVLMWAAKIQRLTWDETLKNAFGEREWANV